MEQNKGTREMALEWWRGLNEDTRFDLANFHFPEKDFVVVNTSSMLIERIFNLNAQV